MNILATLPNGKKVFHGKLERGIFRRIVPHHHVRFSDRSFCLNTSVIKNLLNRSCNILEFLWIKKEVKELYRMGFQEALGKYKPTRNEYGEENLRIPIEDCYIVSRIDLPPQPENSRRSEKQHARVKQETPAPEPVPTLF